MSHLKYIFFSLSYIFLSIHYIHAQEFKLNISGNDSLETRKIDSIGYKKTHPSFKSAEKETNDLLRTLQHQGYIDAFHSLLKKQNDSLFTVNFNLGKPYRTLKIFYPSDIFNLKKLQHLSRKATETYFIIPFHKVESVLEYLNSEIANRGKPFSSIHLSEIKSLHGHQLTAHLIINESQTRTVDSIVIKGYKKFPKAFMRYFVGIKRGNLFNKSKLDKKTENLKNLNFAKSIREPEVLFTQEKTTLYFYLEKQNSNTFEGFLGFSTDEKTKKLKLDGNILMRLTNNLNYGESLMLHYRSNGDDQQHFNVELQLPYLLATPFGLNLELDLFRQDTTYTTNSQSAKITYQISPKTGLEIGYKASSSNFLLDNEVLIGQVNKDYTSGFLTLGMNYMYRNSLSDLFPIRTKASLTVGIGNRKFETGGSKQQRLEFSGQHIFFIDRRNSIYLSNKTAALFSKEYVDNELFRFGGINSMRGFEESSLSATSYSSFQSEYRYLLSQYLYIHSIIDFAHLAHARQKTKNNLYAIGFGLGLKTKAGLLKVDFANGKTDGESFKFDNTTVHLSLTASF